MQYAQVLSRITDKIKRKKGGVTMEHFIENIQLLISNFGYMQWGSEDSLWILSVIPMHLLFTYHLRVKYLFWIFFIGTFIYVGMEGGMFLYCVARISWGLSKMSIKKASTAFVALPSRLDSPSKKIGYSLLKKMFLFYSMVFAVLFAWALLLFVQAY